MKTRLTLAAAFAALAATPAFAQDSGYSGQTQYMQGDHAEVGAGVLVQPTYSGSGSYKAYGVPLLDISKDLTPGNNTVYAKDFTAGYDYHVSDRVLLGLQGAYKFERSTNDDSRLTGMRKVDQTLEVGPRLRAQITPQWGVEGKLLADTMNRNGGYEGRIGTDYVQPINPCLTGFATVGLNYGSKDYNNSYYGVASNEALPGRPATNVGAGFNSVDLGVGTKYHVNDHIALRTSVGADVLIGDAGDSPIVNKQFQPKAMAGVTYTF
jgi:outer membrane protein